MRPTLLSFGLLASNWVSYAIAARVVFPITLTWQTNAPDGFDRKMIMINGQFPGPLLNLEQGDDVEVCLLDLTIGIGMMVILTCCSFG